MILRYAVDAYGTQTRSVHVFFFSRASCKHSDGIILISILQLSRNDPGFAQWTCKGVLLYWRVQLADANAKVSSPFLNDQHMFSECQSSTHNLCISGQIRSNHYTGHVPAQGVSPSSCSSSASTSFLISLFLFNRTTPSNAP